MLDSSSDFFRFLQITPRIFRRALPSPTMADHPLHTKVRQCIYILCPSTDVQSEMYKVVTTMVRALDKNERKCSKQAPTKRRTEATLKAWTAPPTRPTPHGCPNGPRGVCGSPHDLCQAHQPPPKPPSGGSRVSFFSRIEHGIMFFMVCWPKQTIKKT